MRIAKSFSSATGNPTVSRALVPCRGEELIEHLMELGEFLTAARCVPDYALRVYHDIQGNGEAHILHAAEEFPEKVLFALRANDLREGERLFLNQFFRGGAAIRFIYIDAHDRDVRGVIPC